MILEESLRFEPLGPLQTQDDNARAMDPVRPVRGGLQWCAVPSATTGLAYLCTASNELLAIGFDAQSEDPDEAPKILFRTTVPALLLYCAVSSDGRLVAVACGDGSIRCYNALSSKFTERWVLLDAHSHCLSSWKESVSSSRAFGAGASGPLRSLAFCGTKLLWVDDASFESVSRKGKGLQIVEAAVDASPMSISSLPTLSVSCGAWGIDDTPRLAVGTTDGQVFLMEYQNNEFLNQVRINFEESPEGSACNHVMWLAEDTVGASFVTVTQEEEDEEEEEDDSATHEVVFWVLEIDLSSGNVISSKDLGDVVSFFSIPKAGRHIFLTTFVANSMNQPPMILVATNVASDIGVITKEDDQWKVLDIPEDTAVQCPTDPDDEFTFPTGLACMPGPIVLLPTTDGTLSTFRAANDGQDGFFIPVVDVETTLPDKPIPAVAQSATVANPSPAAAPVAAFTFGSTSSPAPSGPSFGVEKAAGPGFNPYVATMSQPTFGAPDFGRSRASSEEEESSSSQSSEEGEWVGGDPAAGFTYKEKKKQSGVTPTPSGFGQSAPSFGTSSGFAFSKPSFGVAAFDSPAPSAPFSFGSGTTAPTFGQPSSLGGSGSTPPAFGQPSSFVSAAFGSSSSNTGPLFGVTSPLGASTEKEKPATMLATSATASEPVSSTPTSGSGPIFGSGFASVGFGGLAKSPPAFGLADPSGADTEISGEDADRAREAFGAVDVTSIGFLPVSRMEDLLEELGEGFHGDELENQVEIIDPDQTGQIQKKAFVSWYVNLVQGADGKGGEDSMDSEDRAEREEERAKAAEEFKKLSTDGSSISADEFPKLLEQMGTTFCEDGDHGRAMKRLTREGKVLLKPFTDWYIDFLFSGDGESEADSTADVEGNQNGNVPEASSEKTPVPLSALFTQAEGSWKCSVCAVTNNKDSARCASCETPKPVLGSSAHKPGSANSSISPSDGGATDGGATDGGLIFSAAVPVAASASSGFSFGFSVESEVSIEKNTTVPDMSAVGFTSSDSQSKTGSKFSFGFSAGGKGTSDEKQSDVTPGTEQAPGEVLVPSVFGSGKGAPIFSFSPKGGSFVNITQSTADPEQSQKSPFGIFGSKTSNNPLGFMAKPLFTDEPNAEQGSAPDTTKQVLKASSVKDPTVEMQSLKATSSQVEDVNAERARKVFDILDVAKVGVLPSTRMEDLLEELGEGFHGDELDKQIAFIDPDKTGQLQRDLFVEWYVGLVQDSNKDEDASIDSEERDEERAHAIEQFNKLSSDGGASIEASQFPMLLENLGTTFCQESSHGRAMKNLTRGGKISREPFVEWYVDFLFDDEDESVDTGSTEEEESGKSLTGAAPVSSWGSTFTLPEGTWRCSVCMIQNEKTLTKCASCETPKPGAELIPEKQEEGKNESDVSGGAGGFAFGAPSATASKFSFGFPSKSSGGQGSTGINFGAPKQDHANVGPPSKGISFRFSSAQPDKYEANKAATIASSGGFTFGFSSPTETKSESTKAAITQKSVGLSSSAAFPPIASSAPKPVGATLGGAKPKPVSSAAFPPIASSAPKPVGATLGDTKLKSSSSAAFPPIASSAPKPVGATLGGAKPKPASSAAFPPIASRAPKPVGATLGGAKPKPASSATFPPIASSAPKPVGATLGDTKLKSSSSAAFPPIASSAPKPVGATLGGAKPKPASSAAFPPIASSAPKPVGATLGGAKPKPASSAAFPPIASRAPKPVGVTLGGAKLKSSSSAAFPPIASSAPKPVGATLGGAKPKPASSAAFPPIASSAPKPVGATLGGTKPSTGTSSGLFGSSTASSSRAPTFDFGSASGSSSMPSFGSGVPKMPTSSPFSSSSKPPVVFPVAAAGPKPMNSGISGSKSSAASTFPPLAAQALKPASASQTESRGTRPPSTVASTSTSQTTSRDTSVQSELDTALSSIARDFETVVKRLSKTQADSSTLKIAHDTSIEEDVEEISVSISEILSSFGEFELSYEDTTNRCAAVLARRANILRDIEKCQALLTSRDSAESQFVLAQPLDADSEVIQRKLSRLAFDLNRQIELVSHRLDLQRKMKKEDGGISLAQERLKIFEHLKSIGEETLRYSDRMKEMETTYSSRTGSRRIPSSVTPFAGSQLVTRPRQADSIGLFLLMGPQAFESLPPPSTAVFSFPDATKVGTAVSSEFIAAKKSSIPPRIRPDSALFAPPPSTNTRPQWDVLSSKDQTKARQVSFTPPTKLNELSVAEAAHDVLNKFGTTPEQLRAYSDARKQPSPPRQSGMPKPASTASSVSLGHEQRVQPETTPSGTAKQSLSSTIRYSSADNAQSQSSSVSVQRQAKPTDDKASSNTSGTDSAAIPSLQNSSGDKAEKNKGPFKSGGGPSGGLGSMSLLGQTSLFSPAASPSNTGTKRSTSSQLGVSKNSPDYRKLLSDFYQKHNEAKTPDFDKLLTKYKGHEADLFAKLAQKYNAPNPLDSLSQPVATAAQSNIVGVQNPPIGATVFAGGPSPSPFSTSSGAAASSNNAAIPATPFGGAAPAPTPFGGSASSPFGAGNRMPAFGSPTGAPAVGFGTAGSAPSAPVLFGSQAPGPSPFPSSSPSPFASSNPPAQAAGTTFAGRNYRDMLVSFYQQQGKFDKIAKVDNILTRYRGNEEDLFRRVAAQYKVDPSVFGLSLVPASGSTPSSGSNFGQASPLGGGPPPFGSPPPGSGPASVGGGQGGFAQFAGSPATFGAASPSTGGGFGTLAQSPRAGFGGFGGSRFGSSPSPFVGGGPPPFGGPRR